MSISTRRSFILHAIAGGSSLAATRAMAQAGPKVEETDPTAAALGYKQDAAKVEAAKYPKRGATDNCAGCQLFQGKAGDATGGCPLFAGKQVSSKGWCSAWAKKVG